MTDDKLKEFSKKNWNSLPEDKRTYMINELRVWIGQDLLDEWKREGLPDGFHFFGGGMQVRNKLREYLVDGDLPPVLYEDGGSFQNWDDYYMGAMYQLLEDN